MPRRGKTFSHYSDLHINFLHYFTKVGQIENLLDMRCIFTQHIYSKTDIYVAHKGTKDCGLISYFQLQWLLGWYLEDQIVTMISAIHDSIPTSPLHPLRDISSMTLSMNQEKAPIQSNTLKVPLDRGVTPYILP